MTLVPLTTCCLSLGVDPKTLRLWLKTAQMSCCAHPGDARLKCLTLQELEQLAQLHHRPLPSLVPVMASHPVTVSGAAAAAQEPSTAPPGPETVHLSYQLNVLQQQVATLQAQVAELALALLAVHPSRQQPPPTAPLAGPAVPEPGSTPAVASVLAPLVDPVPPTTPTAQARPRVRSRALPLIQVRTDGSVVVIAPQEGVLPLVPDSAPWFAWLASIEAFSFEGPAGRYSATRKFRSGQRIQAWTAHGSLHGRSCGLYLGQTPALTLTRLQQMAATVRARLTAS